MTQVDLQDRVAVVTGGAGGIGAAVSDALATAGAHVVVVDVDAQRVHDTVERITGNGGTAEELVADVREAQEIERLDAAVARRGRIDILVNNVGHYLRPTPLLESDEAHWSGLHEINLLHVLRCCRALVPRMVERRSGSVINVASVEAIRGYPPDPVYGAYKAGVAHFTRCFALEVAQHGVRVNAIGPDVTQTIQVDYERSVPEELRDRWPIWVPVGRVGAPEDNADVVLFLASDLARFVTGHVVPTDGGTLVAGGWFRTMGRGAWTNRPRNP
jgi:NAD(P)-dependent dehydrogenase (short-subunit alcohol dehydrogenase family)